MQQFGYKILAEPRPYSTTRQKIRRGLMLIFFLISIAVCWWDMVLALVIFVFSIGMIVNIPLLEDDRFFIKAFYIWNGQVVIDYRDKNEYKRLSGTTADFRIRLEGKGSRGIAVTYNMQVYHKKVKVITQREVEGWTEPMFRNLKNQLV